MADEMRDRDGNLIPDNLQDGIQTGGHANDGTPDTRGITEKVADTVTGDNIDDKTGKRVDAGRLDPAGDNKGSYAYADGDDDLVPGNGIPGIQTGGHNADGSKDTRGITEKIADTVTGDKVDDKTGKRTD